MAMNFWEAQRKARSKTTFYLFVFITMTVLIAVALELFLRQVDPVNFGGNIPIAGLAFLGITFSVSLFQYAQFSAFGGSYVAESVGGRQIDPETTHPVHRQLMNIVNEVAVASGVPTPPVYILPVNDINAFAAGLSSDKAAIAITEGALKILNRDEVQGVIAHEFGHIYNGDMKISMRLAAMLMGFFFILYIGFRLIDIAAFSRRSDDRDRGGNPMLLVALAFIVAGSITWFAGGILKAMVSRQREYLADACAVQFTRNPDGIAGALRKIRQVEPPKDMPSSGMAYSHMYFNDDSFMSALFATHPSLEKRIAAIEGREYIPEEWDIKATH